MHTNKITPEDIMRLPEKARLKYLRKANPEIDIKKLVKYTEEDVKKSLLKENIVDKICYLIGQNTIPIPGIIEATVYFEAQGYLEYSTGSLDINDISDGDLEHKLEAFLEGDHPTGYIPSFADFLEYLEDNVSDLVENCNRGDCVSDYECFEFLNIDEFEYEILEYNAECRPILTDY